MKHCCKCRQEKELEQFYRRTSSKDGHSPECKLCCHARKREWQKTHLDRVRPATKRWADKNREQLRAKDKARREKAKAEKREREGLNVPTPPDLAARYERQRMWRESHRKEICERVKAWQRAHPEAGRAAWHRRRARKKAAGGTFTAKQVDGLYKLQKGRCWWNTTHKLDKGYHIDHRIPLARGGSNDIANIVLACPNCNLRKHDKLPAEFAGRLL